MKAGIDVYTSPGTIEALQLQGHRLHAIHAKKRFSIGTWTILPFEAEHDATEPLGFLMASTTGEKLLYLTDSFYCRYKFKDLTHIMIETNYAADILAKNIEAGIVAPEQKKRILRSHFSLENVKEFLKANDLSRVREIHLLHLSNDNSDADRFKAEIEALTGKPVYIA
jgi:phosphoribosyl 1,2-cyclic phosphodiesterase